MCMKKKDNNLTYSEVRVSNGSISCFNRPKWFTEASKSGRKKKKINNTFLGKKKERNLTNDKEKR